jgi:hypothetical protein
MCSSLFAEHGFSADDDAMLSRAYRDACVEISRRIPVSDLVCRRIASGMLTLFRAGQRDQEALVRYSVHEAVYL